MESEKIDIMVGDVVLNDGNIPSKDILQKLRDFMIENDICRIDVFIKNGINLI